jgi:hypothetical protein
MARTMAPVELPDDLRGAEGKWAAIKGGKVVGIQDTADRLYTYLHSNQITGATILRVPTEEEPELVGLG